MGAHRLRSMATDEEYDAFHFEGPGDFEGLEKFVGGDAEIRGNKIIVAGPEGRLELDLNGWVVNIGPSKFSTSSDVATKLLFKEI